ncbi:MAG: hypothetical protein NTX36_06050 [Proteobacteria bacterium]|nr:hypothetical protein [Pseudomonadota bacterium]
MKKVCIYILAALLLYSLFREFTLVKTLLICAGLAAAYGIYRLPSKYVMAMKYPFILLSFAATTGLFFYPTVELQYPLDALVVFVSFYSVTFFLIAMDEKKKDFAKETIALSILFLSLAFNLYIIGKTIFILPMAFTVMLFLFIVGRNRAILFIAGYTAIIIIFFLVKNVNILGGGIRLNDMERYFLLITSFLFLAVNFIDFVKKNTMSKLLTFFGFLYVAVDIAMVLGFKLSMGLLYQPLIGLFIITPLIGIMLKTEGERA